MQRVPEEVFKAYDIRGLYPEEIDAEKELLDNTAPVEPIKADKTPGRNDPCPCGSGRKYKKCCANK